MKNSKQSDRSAKAYIIKWAVNCSKQGQKASIAIKMPHCCNARNYSRAQKSLLHINPVKSPSHAVYTMYQIALIWKSPVTPFLWQRKRELKQTLCL